MKTLTGNNLLSHLIRQEFDNTVGNANEAEENIALIDLAKRHGLPELADGMINDWADDNGKPYYHKIKAARELSDDLQPGEVDARERVVILVEAWEPPCEEAAKPRELTDEEIIRMPVDEIFAHYGCIDKPLRYSAKTAIEEKIAELKTKRDLQLDEYHQWNTERLNRTGTHD